MTAPLGFGIVGAGVIARTHAGAIASLPGARLRAIADIDTAQSERLALVFGVDAASGIDTVLDRRDIDVVCVCVPSGLHAEVGIRAAGAGKHVVVEKPIDVSLEAADRLIAACRRNGVVLSVISQRRYDPGVQRLREAIVAGRLGHLVLADAAVKWFRSQQYYESAAWRGTWDLDGGGALMNQGIHSVDLVRWLMGPVESVVGRVATVAHDIPVEDLAVALLRFASGAMGVIEASTAAYPGFAERLEVMGTGGSVVLEGGEVLGWQLSDEGGDPGHYGRLVRLHAAPPPSGNVSGHAAQLRDVVEAIERGREPAITGEDGRAALELVLAVYASARRGEEVALPLEPVRASS